MMDLQLQKALFDLFQSHLKFPFYDGLSDEGYPYAAFGYTQDSALDTKTSEQIMNLLSENILFN